MGSMPPKMKQQIGNAQLNGFLEITNSSHHGKSVKYNATPQFDGTIDNSARLTKEKPIDFSFPNPPVFAGTFWYDCTKQFIQSHKDMAARKSEVEVNGIKSQVLEWKVSDAEKFKAFHAARRGGLLRLYVSPELGFVLPKLEHIGPDGQIDTKYDWSDFKEHAPGIFIPRNCRMQNYINGAPSFYVEYEITAVNQLNEQIPDNEFVVQLPTGTVVADSRSGKSSTIFEIQQGGPIPEGLEDIIAAQSPPFWGRNWHSALIVGIGVGVLLLALFILWRRSLLRRRNP